MTRPTWPEQPTPVVVTGVVDRVTPGRIEINRIVIENRGEVKYGDYVRVTGVMQPDGMVVGGEVEIIERRLGNPVLIALTDLRETLILRVRKVLPEPHAALLVGIVLGARAELPKVFQKQLRQTGTTHIVVASGMNVSFLLGVVLILLPFVGRQNAVMGGLLLILFYVLLIGFDPPIVRAGIMAGLAMVGQFFGRQRHGVWLLGVTAGMMLLFDPQLVHSVSFQLSFAATLGILLLEERIRSLLTVSLSVSLPGGIKNVVNTLRKDLSTTLAAQVMVTPILIHSFHQVSILSPGANALILWTVLPIMVIGFVSMVFLFIPLIGALTIWIAWPLLHYFVTVLGWFDHIPLALLTFPELPGWVWIGWYGVILAAITFSGDTRVNNES